MTEEPLRVNQSRHILVVDDEINIRWSVCRALELKGYQVTAAESGEAALEELSRHHIDLVITDIRMPGMDGFDLVSWLRENRPDVAVVITTAFGSLNTRERSMKVGAVSYLEKPMDFDALSNFLDRLFKPPRFAGRVSDIDLLDYLQLIASTRKTKSILITNHQDVGRLVFEDGQIVHAECGEMSGLDAFNEIMYWEGGTFSDVPYEPPLKRTIEENTAYLLMESARLRDERTYEEELMGRSVSLERPEDLEEEDEPAAERTYSGPYARHRSFLEKLTKRKDVIGALLASREGLILARSGTLPAQPEMLLLTFSGTFVQVGDALGFGACDYGLLRLRAGKSILIYPFETSVLGVWLVPDGGAGPIVEWIRTQAGTLD